MKRVTCRIAAWIACFAMLLAALAPSISHAFMPPSGETWGEICTVGGTKLVKLSVDKSATGDPAKPGEGHFKHCPFCATHADPLAVPPHAGFVIPLINTPDLHPFLFLQSPHPLAIWTVAQSRAPPASI